MLDIIIVNSILCDFLGIECCCRSLDRAAKPIIIVTHMVSHFNYLFFFHVCGVDYNFVMNWSGWCCSRILVCHHVEIKILITIIVYDIWLNYCSFYRILFRLVRNLEKSCNIIFVYKYVQYFWIIVLIEFLECFIQLFFWFKYQAFIFVIRASNCISIDYDLTWSFIFIDFSPIFKSFNYKCKNQIFPFLTNNIV